MEKDIMFFSLHVLNYTNILVLFVIQLPVQIIPAYFNHFQALLQKPIQKKTHITSTSWHLVVLFPTFLGFDSNRYSLPSRHWGECTDSSAPRKVSNLGFEGSTSLIIYIIDTDLLFNKAVKFYVWNSYIENLDQVSFFFVVLIIIKTPETALRWTCIWDTSVTWILDVQSGIPITTSIFFTVTGRDNPR